MTEFFYPDFDLLEGLPKVRANVFCGDASLFRRNAAQRFAAPTLIRHDAVDAHTAEDSYSENRVFVKAKSGRVCSHKALPFMMDPNDDSPSALTSSQKHLNALLFNMQQAQELQDNTSLSSLLYSHTDDPAECWVKLRQKSSYHHAGLNPSSAPKVLYTIKLNDIMSFACPPQWLAQFGVMWGALDSRACSAILHNMDDTVRVLIPYPHDTFRHKAKMFEHFLQPRYEDFGDPLRAITTQVTEVDQRCSLCFEGIEEEGKRLVSLNCSNATALHVYCEPCLLEQCQTEGPIDARCAYCRHPIFDPAMANEIAFGTKLGIYNYDSRYSAFQNFERACADLDVNLPETNDRDLATVNAYLFQVIFNDVMLFGATLESCEFTMLHHQAVRFPEMKEVVQSIFAYIFRRDKEKSLCSQLHTLIMEQAGYALQEQIIQAGMDLYFHMDRGDPKTGFDGKPGLEELVSRMVNRTLAFCELRRCNCTGGDLFHDHGARRYWNHNELELMDAMYDASMNSDDSDNDDNSYDDNSDDDDNQEPIDPDLSGIYDPMEV